MVSSSPEINEIPQKLNEYSSQQDTISIDMIDKYAQFVARNGPQFEQMTFDKQQNNPRFAFMQPNGPMHEYYQNRLAMERERCLLERETDPNRLIEYSRPPPSIDHQTFSPHLPQAFSSQTGNENTWLHHPSNSTYQSTPETMHHYPLISQPYGPRPPIDNSGFFENWRMTHPTFYDQCKPAHYYRPTSPGFSPFHPPLHRSPYSGPGVHASITPKTNAIHQHQQQLPPAPTILLRLLSGSDFNGNNPTASNGLTTNEIYSLGESAAESIRIRLMRHSEHLAIDTENLASAIDKAMDACTKDNIANARRAIIEKAITSSEHANFLVCLFLQKVVCQKDDGSGSGVNETVASVEDSESAFKSAQRRLHALYLLNDVLSHCSKLMSTSVKPSSDTDQTKLKPAVSAGKLELLRQELEPSLPLLFGSSAINTKCRTVNDSLQAENPTEQSITESQDLERCSKLIKLLDLWRKNKYFSKGDNLEELAEGVACLSSDGPEYEDSSKRIAQYAIVYLQKEFKPEMDRLNMSRYGPINNGFASTGGYYQGVPPMNPYRQHDPGCYPPPPPPFVHPSSTMYVRRPVFPPRMSYPQLYRGRAPATFDYNHQPLARPNRYAPLLATPPAPLFDPSQPPPGFPNHSLQTTLHPHSRMQSVNPRLVDSPPPLPQIVVKRDSSSEEEVSGDEASQYYSLPAGIMCLHIKPQDCEYAPLNPKLIRPLSPATTEQAQKINDALEKFYEETRSKDGWEPTGLFSFYKEKFLCKIAKRKELFEKRAAKSGRQRSTRKASSRSSTDTRSLSEESRSSSRSSGDGKRRRSRRKRTPLDYHSKGRSSSRSSKYIESDESLGSSDHQSDASSISDGSSSKRRRSRQSRRRRSHRRERSHYVSSHKRRGGDDSNSSRLGAAEAGTIPDPSYHMASELIRSRPIDESNKGHQLLQKMGWSGMGGLGKKEQGIVEPIDQGDVRDKSDKYKGVGVDSDVFDEFRKRGRQKYLRMWSDSSGKI